MNSISSEAHFRQRVIRYAEKYGVTAASNRHHRSRQAIYEWKAKYDGNWKSLIDKILFKSALEQYHYISLYKSSNITAQR